MAVGDRIVVTENIARAQAYVHTYGKQTGKAFRTKKFALEDGAEVLGVKRLPDPAQEARTVEAVAGVWGAPDSRTSWPFKTLRVGESTKGLVHTKLKAQWAAYIYMRQSGKAFDLTFTQTPQGVVMEATRTV
jgi:hypothetical protein